MTDPSDDSAVAQRPRLNGQDVVQVTFVVIGLTIAAALHGFSWGQQRGRHCMDLLGTVVWSRLMRC
jgi:hypothetical protein